MSDASAERILAAIEGIGNRFDAFDSRLVGIDGRLGAFSDRLDGIDGRLGAFSDRLDGIDGRLGAFSDRLDGIDGRLGAFSDRLDGIDGRLGAFSDRLDGIDGRLDALEAVQGRLRADVMERIDRVQNAVTQLRDDFAVSFGASDAAKRANDNTREELRSLSEVVYVMVRQVRTLAGRVDQLEGKH